eukprot:4042016-Alexandrium_andersonii.AAC.1
MQALGRISRELGRRRSEASAASFSQADLAASQESVPASDVPDWTAQAPEPSPAAAPTPAIACPPP